MRSRIKKRSVVIYLYVLLASVAVVMIALCSWFYELITKNEIWKRKRCI